MRLSPILALLLALTVLSGCNTFERRAQKKAEVFATLSPETKARLETQTVQVGDSFDLVYIALGEPDEKRQSTTAAGQSTTWIYNRYWQEYQGEASGGFRRVAVRDKSGASTYYYEPISRPVYSQRQQAYLRVVFTDGKVSVIEQAKP